MRFLSTNDAMLVDRRRAIRSVLPFIGASLHVGQMIYFTALDMPSWMALMSIGSIAIYGLSVWLVRAGWPILGMWIAYGEIVSHVALFTILFGTAADYMFYLGPMAISAFLVFGREDGGHRVAGVIVAFAVAIVLLVYSYFAPPFVLLSAFHLDALSRANVFATIAADVAEVAWFAWVSENADDALARERGRMEDLLKNVFPASIAERLKRDPGTIAESCDEVAVLFADIVGFTPMAAKMSPIDLVTLLDGVFSRFDALADGHKLEKIKTIGDAYLVVGGIPEAHADPVFAMAQMAMAMRATIADVSRASGQPLDVRIGMAVGPVVAGVIGRRRFAYDLWGDTVNTAARMESHGAPGEIHVTRAVSDKLAGRIACESRGLQHIKGKGDMETFFLKDEHRA